MPSHAGRSDNQKQNANEAGNYAAPRPLPRYLGGWVIGASRNAGRSLRLLVRGNVLIRPIARGPESYRRAAELVRVTGATNR
jgi:hypothetical protein